jgi:hypothetical protein
MPIARAATSWRSAPPPDGLLAFGRKCLQDSGLISKDSADVGARLSAIDMNRDDKAHRFVVTWNAFLDGNRLAYLSLTLAIGVDLLVFMSGLFGAQALRSPLSDVPSPKARSAHQLEAIIEAALLPDVFKNARLALSALHPGNGGRLYQRGPALRARSRERLASARRAERRRDHRSGARDGHARPLPRALGAAHLPFRRRQAGAQEEAEETERGSASIGSKSASARR